MKQRIQKKQLWCIGIGLAIMVAAMLFLVRPFDSADIKNQDGSYTITSIRGLVCLESYPPQCSGEITLRSASSGDEQQVVIDRQTVVQRDPQSTQLYPDSLQEGMIVQVAFKPGGNTASSINLVD